MSGASTYIGRVTSVDDAQLRGRIEVAIPELGGSEPWGFIEMLENGMFKVPSVGDLVGVSVQGDLALYLGKVPRKGGATQDMCEAGQTAAEQTQGSGKGAAIPRPTLSELALRTETLIRTEELSALAARNKALRELAASGTTLRQLADRAAIRHGIPTNVFRAVISAESSWNPNAYNPKASRASWANSIQKHRFHPGETGAWEPSPGKPIRGHAEFKNSAAWGAYGLGQVLLSAALTNGQSFEQSAADLFDPAHNLEVSARILKKNFKKANGNVPLALVLYNAGAFHPHNAPKNRRTYHTADPLTWPLKTRLKYVPKILRIARAESQGGGVSAGLESRDVPSSVIGKNDQTTSTVAKGSAVIETTAVVDRAASQWAFAGTAVQPGSFAAPEYPHNKVISTDEGHRFEMDDTPDAERIHLFHRSGSFMEIGAAGQKSTRQSAKTDITDGARRSRGGPTIDVAEGDRTTETRGKDVVVTGPKIEKNKGPRTTIVEGPVLTEVNGVWDETSQGRRKIKAVGELSLIGVDAHLGAVKDIHIISKGGTVGVTAATTVSVLGGSEARVAVPLGKGKVKLGDHTTDALKAPVLNKAAYDSLRDLIDDLVAGLTEAAAGLNTAPLTPVGLAFTAALTKWQTATNVRIRALETSNLRGRSHLWTVSTEAD